MVKFNIFFTAAASIWTATAQEIFLHFKDGEEADALKLKEYIGELVPPHGYLTDVKRFKELFPQFVNEETSKGFKLEDDMVYDVAVRVNGRRLSGPGYWPRDVLQRHLITKGSCSICMSPIADSELIETKCRRGRHTFHKSCLQEWSKRKQSCPICRHGFSSGVIAEGTDYSIKKGVYLSLKPVVDPAQGVRTGRYPLPQIKEGERTVFKDPREKFTKTHFDNSQTFSDSEMRFFYPKFGSGDPECFKKPASPYFLFKPEYQIYKQAVWKAGREVVFDPSADDPTNVTLVAMEAEPAQLEVALNYLKNHLPDKIPPEHHQRRDHVRAVINDMYGNYANLNDLYQSARYAGPGGQLQFFYADEYNREWKITKFHNRAMTAYDLIRVVYSFIESNGQRWWRDTVHNQMSGGTANRRDPFAELRIFPTLSRRSRGASGGGGAGGGAGGGYAGGASADPQPNFGALDGHMADDAAFLDHQRHFIN